MKYRFKFMGQPDFRFPFLKTGKVYYLEIKEYDNKPVIVYPFNCPYSSWENVF